VLDQHRPDPSQDAMAAPALEPAVDRAIVAEVLGQLVPLTSRAEAEDDAVEGRPQVDAGPAAVLLRWRRRVLQEDRLDACPEGVIDFPDGRQRFNDSTGPSHDSGLLVHEVSLLKLRSQKP
jgi:hypothetical protein